MNIIQTLLPSLPVDPPEPCGCGCADEMEHAKMVRFAKDWAGDADWERFKDERED